MWDKEGSGFFGVKGLRDGTKYIHLCYCKLIRCVLNEVIYFVIILSIVNKF